MYSEPRLRPAPLNAAAQAAVTMSATASPARAPALRIGMIGLGTVGMGTWTVLKRNQPLIAARAGRGVEVVAIAVRDRVRAAEKLGDAALENVELSSDPHYVATHPDVDVLVELAGGTGPARDWVQAASIARKMQAANQGDFSARLAHYLCEDAQTQITKAQFDTANAQLLQAVEIAPHAPRPRLELAQLQHRQGHSAQALQTLNELAEQSPASLPLAATLLVQIAQASGEISAVQALLARHYAQAPSLDLLQAQVALDGDNAGAPGRSRFVQHLEHEPSLVAAAQWLEGETLAEEQHHAAVQKALDHAAKPLTRYRCAACGFEARTHFWHCPGCQSWDSYPARRVEEL